uniref:Uncharacterized protein TCIL3000_9_4440 n=1 Tax=Trypanosoma congolense (strain IL3000) TaxID=1068625 RepID=G0UUI0_TRYCI|nr:unnamed protein product [Trypanosoma congolense IL3000]
MIGTVESILYDGDLVRSVEVRLPSRDSPQGRLLSLRLKERLGNGSFGMVYYGCCDEYPKLAVKISTGKNKRLKEELEVLSKVCTKGKLLLPRFEFGAINKTGDLIAIGMELCVPSTLHDLLIAEPLTQEADMLFIAHQVVKAVSYVHEHHCIHRDVKLKNFVFDLDGNLKLIDFGLASPVWQPPPGDLVAGTISFMAPEMAHNALNRDERVSVGAAADVWSVGIVLFSIFAQRIPYSLRDTNEKPGDACDSDSGDEGHGVPYSKELPMLKVNFQLLRRVAAGDWRWPDDCDISPALRNLVEFVLVADQHKRPSITDVLNRPEWEARRRATPLVVLRFLGVEDDFLLSHDEAHLLRAVEQRGADVNASSSCEQTKLSCEDTSEDAQRASLKFVAREEVSVGGIPTHQVYDMRPDPRRKRPIREISVVLAEENARSLGRSRSRSSRAAMMSTSRGASHRVTRSKTVTPVPQTPEAVKNGDEALSESDSSSVIFVGSRQGGKGLAGAHKSGTNVEGNVGHGGEILTDTTTLPTSLSAVSDLVTHSEELRGAAVLGSTRPDKNRGGSPFGLRSNGKQPAVRENPATGASTRVLKRSKASRTEDAEEVADVTNLRSLVAMERSVRRFLAARLL